MLASKNSSKGSGLISETDRTASEPLVRNIDALMRRRKEASEHESLTERLAGAMAGFAGSMWSVWIHAAVFGAWILINIQAIRFLPPWDPSLVVLAMIASVEAIFLTTFVLINQRRQARIEDERAELTVQASLLTEQELTRIASLMIAIAKHSGVTVPAELNLEEVTAEVPPETILQELDRTRSAANEIESTRTSRS